MTWRMFEVPFKTKTKDLDKHVMRLKTSEEIKKKEMGNKQEENKENKKELEERLRGDRKLFSV